MPKNPDLIAIADPEERRRLRKQLRRQLRKAMTDPLDELNQSVDEFCASEGISRSAYYGIKRAGTGPDELHAGARRLITPEARKRWRKRRTVPARRQGVQPAQSAS
jgi:hypothetical protein